MQTSNRILDDLAKVANGAVSTLNGMKGEIEAMVRHRVERIMADADMVPRDEFEAVKAMASEARLQQEALEKRVADLEAKLAKSSTAPRKHATGKTAKRKSSTAKATSGASAKKS